jgi:hypothetical protein
VCENGLVVLINDIFLTSLSRLCSPLRIGQAVLIYTSSMSTDQQKSANRRIKQWLETERRIVGRLLPLTALSGTLRWFLAESLR